MTPLAQPSAMRAWRYLVWLSWQRQARAHLLVWISLGLLAFVSFLIFITTRADGWNISYWRMPRSGPRLMEHLGNLEFAGHLPWDPAGAATHWAVWGGIQAFVLDGSGFHVFSNWIVFSIYVSFLLPLWTIAFATEGIGREWESRNLLWVLTRPMPRAAIFLGKFIALLPWCLGLNLGGFFLMCQLAGFPGRLAFAVYWPAVLMGALAFAALFHALAAWFRRSALLAILYTLFFETIAGNLPGHFKRLSLTFYTNCLMVERAGEFGIQPRNPHTYLPVSGTTALIVLALASFLFLTVGLWAFSRQEYGDVP